MGRHLEMSSSKKSVTCPNCHKVFGSSIEYQLHWSHNHPGRVLAPLIQFVPSGIAESAMSKVVVFASNGTAQGCSWLFVVVLQILLNFQQLNVFCFNGKAFDKYSCTNLSNSCSVIT